MNCCHIRSQEFSAFDKFNWRWAFYVNLSRDDCPALDTSADIGCTVIGGVFAPVYLFLLPSYDPQPKGTSLRDRVRNFDVLGAALSIGSIMCLLMAINFGGAMYRWNSGQNIALFVVAVILLVAFSIQQRLAWLTTTTERMFPVHLLKIMEANLLFVAAAGCNAAGFIPIYYIPTYFQFTRGDNALEAAVRLLPLIILLSATIIANGYLMSKLGYYQPWYLVGSALALIGNVLLSLTTPTTSTAAIYGYEVLVAIGSGAFVQAGYATIQTVVTPSDTPQAIAFMMLAQFAGIVLGLSVAGAVFINEALTALRVVLPDIPDSQLRQLIGGTSSGILNDVSHGLADEAIDAIVYSLRKVFIPAYTAAAVALLVSLFIKRSKAFHVIRENT